MIFPTLAVQQPWAYAMLHLGKDVENRSRPLPKKYIGVPVLIHASKKFDLISWSRLSMSGLSLPEPDMLDTGGIVGAVIFAESRFDASTSLWAAPGLHHWRIRAAQELTFHPCTGRLGFFSTDYPHSLTIF